MRRQQIALLGDSLTQQSFDFGGWGGRLASLYQRTADITLRGYSGYNTRWALQTLDHNFPLKGRRYDLATIWYGANDAALANGSGARQHVPLDEYKQNLGIFVDRMVALGAAVVVFTPPPVDDAARKQLAVEEGITAEEARAERTLEAARQYAEAAKEVARSKGVLCLDLWTGLQSKPDWQELLSDGLHFNPQGQAAVFDLLHSFIIQNLPQFRPENLAPDFPWHTNLQPESYLDTFKAHGTS